MVRAPHLEQRDAEWSATTGTTKVVGGAMADGRESGALEGPSPEHEPPLFSVFFFLSRGRRLPRETQETLDRRGGPLGVDGTQAARAVPRPSCSVPAPRLVVVVVVVVSSSFFFSMARVTDPLSNLALAFRIGSELGRAVPRSFRERNWNPRLLFDRRLPLRGDGAKGRAQRLANTHTTHKQPWDACTPRERV